MDLNHKQAQIFCPTFMPQRLEEKKLEIKNKQKTFQILFKLNETCLRKKKDLRLLFFCLRTFILFRNLFPFFGFSRFLYCGAKFETSYESVNPFKI